MTIQRNLNNPQSVSLVGVPTDIGASALGSAMGPSALRVAGIAQAIQSLGIEVHDCGDLNGPANPNESPIDGFRHLDQVIQWNQSVFSAITQQLESGHLPVMMGGDHSLAIGSITAVAQHCHKNHKTLRVLWLDAHTDINTSLLSPTGNMHGMPVACLLGLGPQALTHLAHHSPPLTAEQIFQIGIRSVDAGERQLAHDLGIHIFDIRAIDELGMREVMVRALKDIDENTHLHISMDVDFLDPDIAPGVASTVRGGPTYREAQLCMEMIAETGQLGSLDIVELNPAYDIRNQTALLSVDLIKSLFGQSTLIRTAKPSAS